MSFSFDALRFPLGDPRRDYRTPIIAVGGPPHSGKTVFLNALYHHLNRLNSGHFFRETACPDGEGSWSMEAHPKTVAELRKKYPFSEEFVQHKLKGISRMGKDNIHRLVLVDLGGWLPGQDREQKESSENVRLLRACTHVILLSREAEALAQWKARSLELGCSVVALFDSQLIYLADGTFDRSVRSRLLLDDLPLRGTFYNLVRSQDRDPDDKAIVPSQDREAYEAAIVQLAHWLRGVPNTPIA
jgi:CRISPR-associated protein Csx3